MPLPTFETLIPAAKVRERIEALGLQITRDYPVNPIEKPLHLVGVLKGSFIFLDELAKAIDREVSIDFIGAGSYGTRTTTSGNVRLTKDIDESIKGRDVILVEDIIDTGLTIRWLYEFLQARNPRTMRIATLLDKPSRRIKPIELHYVGFEVSDQFVVGYGLDYAQRYRNLPDICVLQNPDPAIEA